MEYIKLYRYLRQEEMLTRVQAVRSTYGVRKLDKEIRTGLAVWVKTGKCDLVIADVSFNELIEKEGMKPIRAFKMLDWLKREPLTAYYYLKHRIALADLSKHGSAKVATVIAETDQSDIEL